jgi:hypothetical protein
MKDYRNFILINNDKNIIASSFANCSSEVNYKVHERAFPDKKGFNNYTDILKILNKHLAQIIQWKEDDTALSIYYVLIPSKLCKIIKDKLFKKWLDTGERVNGLKISKEELAQWEVFNILYKHVFADICFKPNNAYNKNNANKNYKHVIFTINVVDKMHNYLDQLEERNKIKTIDDLLKYNNI